MNDYMKVIINALKRWVNKRLTVLDEKINNKVESVEGKMLSTNDYTNEEKRKLANIEAGATRTVVNGQTGNVQINIPEVLVTSVNGMAGDVVIDVPSVDGFATEAYVGETITKHLTDTELILTSSTSGSTKKFKITIDDDGVLTATEIVESAT